MISSGPQGVARPQFWHTVYSWFGSSVAETAPETAGGMFPVKVDCPQCLHLTINVEPSTITRLPLAVSENCIEDVFIVPVVEPEHELIQVGLKILGADAVVDADDNPVEQTPKVLSTIVPRTFERKF